MKNWVASSLVWVSVAAALFQICAWAQTDNIVQRVTGKDRTIIVREHGKDHTYDFDEDLQLREIGEARLLFQNRVNGKLYLLAYIVESVGSGNGQCGAGQEEYLIWQVLDSKWAQDDHKLELIASCAVSIENRSPGRKPYEIGQGKLTSEYNNYRDNVACTLTYDSAKPEKAWTIQRRPLPASGPL